MNHNKGSPSAKVLSIDIETSPSLGYFFDFKKEYNIVKIVRPWIILSVSWRWGHENKVHVLGLCDYPRYKRNKLDDRPLIKDIWKLLDEADFIIAHNGDRFDLKKIRSRFLKHGLKPTSPFKTIDTLKVLRKYFAEDSNRLDAFSKTHGLGGKLPHEGFKLWDDCIEGVPSAWMTMKAYNQHDVVLLDKTYKLIAPWMDNHPNFRLFDGKFGCPVCASKHIIKRGVGHRATYSIIRLTCKGCGKNFYGEKIKRI